jgi:hypothetical protein
MKRRPESDRGETTSTAPASRLLDRIDRLVAQVGRLGRREAFGALQDVFAEVKAHPALSRSEVTRFMDLVTLILLVYPRGLRIRISGARQTGRVRETRLEFNEHYETALERTMAFLARNFLNHIDEYEPQQYVRAVLRELAKEYAREHDERSHDVPVDAVLERVAPEGAAAGALEPQPDEAPVWLSDYDYIRTVQPDGALFYDWFVGTLSRQELVRLYGMTREQVDAALLRIARSAFERGRLYPLVSTLVRLAEDGDILWLSLKGLTGNQIGQKVAKSNWVVYKRLDLLRRRFARLREMGDAGRAFGAWLCGRPADVDQAALVRRVLHEHGAELGLDEKEFPDPGPARPPLVS